MLQTKTRSLVESQSYLIPIDSSEPRAAKRADVLAIRRPLTRAEVEEILRAPSRIRLFGKRRFPRLVPAGNIEDLPVNARVQTCLREFKKHNRLVSLSDLSDFSIEELLASRKFGTKSLLNLLSSVMPVILDCSRTVVQKAHVTDAVTRAAERLRANPYSERLHCADVRFRAEAGELLFIANASSDGVPLSPPASLRSIADRLVRRTRETATMNRVLGASKLILGKIGQTTKLTLEEELEQITRAFVDGKKADVTLSHLGWSGLGIRGMQEVGNDFNISRERVRQLADEFRDRTRGTRLFTPILERTIAFIQDRLPAMADEMEAEIQGHGLTRTRFRLDGLLSAAGIFRVPIPFAMDKHRGMRLIVHHKDAGLAKSVTQYARKSVSRVGLGNVTHLCEQFKRRSPLIQKGLISDALESDMSLRWLDEKREWFFLGDVQRNHLVNLVMKVLSVSPTIDIRELTEAMANDQRGLGFAPPRSVVLKFCSTACGCRIEDDQIIAVRTPCIRKVLSDGEQLFYSILVKHGPLLDRRDLKRKCLERGMNANTVTMYLHRLPILRKYGSEMYGLRGNRVVSKHTDRVSGVIESEARIECAV